jgi:CheY-like chemotaxis protein
MKEKLAKIFDSFTQADSSTTRKYGGTGLGLSISKSLAELMEGALSVKSEIGKGSTFTLHLPFEIINSEPQILSGHKPPLKKVLVIDDNATNRWLMQEIFRYFNIACEVADGGTEALQILKRIQKTKESLDLIISDHHMPEMDGLQLVREIRKIKGLSQPAILMLSSLEKNMFQHEADKLGIHSLLTKPVKMYELYALLAAMFNTGKPPEKQIIVTPTIEKISENSATIMVVEDEPINMMLITEVLNKMGFEVLKAINGKHALEVLTSNGKHDPILIFMDVNMPEMDGFDTTRHIRQLPEPYKSIPIIALTADAMKDDRDKCMAAGMNDYISKPFKIEEIEAVLKNRMPPV